MPTFTTAPGAGLLSRSGDTDAANSQQQARRAPLQFALRSSSSRGPAAAFASLSVASAAKTASANGLQLLPVGSHRGGKHQQFAWDGTKVVAINDDLLAEGYTAAGRLQDLLGQLHENVRRSFIPRKDDVTDDYWEWLRWRLGQRFFSATLQNFATQSLLMAVGVGARKALAASAAINWMLKDGMNRLVRMSVATQFGDSFDSDLKRFRFTTSVLYTACVSCEFLTPLFPSHFLLLAAVSNVGRAVGLTTFVSTQPAFQQALCASGNMADLASKTQAQHMVMDTLALAVSASANYALRHREAQRMLLPLIAFPICGLADLFCIFHELKAVQLRSLNRERAEMTADFWLQQGAAPCFRDISARERLWGPPDIANNLLPLRILPLERSVAGPGQLVQLLSAYKGSKYLLSLQPGEQLPWWQLWERCFEQYRCAPHIAVTLQAGAQPRDILTAVLEAGYLRQALQQEQALRTSQAGCSCSSGGSGSSAGKGRQQQRSSGSSGGRCGCVSCSCSSGGGGGGGGGCGCGCSSGPVLPVEALSAEYVAAGSSSSVRRQAKSRAEKQVGAFMHDLSAKGWQVKPFLLSASEKSMFERL